MSNPSGYQTSFLIFSRKVIIAEIVFLLSLTMSKFEPVSNTNLVLISKFERTTPYFGLVFYLALDL
jgi:hypothetical protein